MKVYDFDDLKTIINDLKSGKLLIIPTDTIYGFSCSITAFDAEKRIFKLKNRDENKQLIILVSSIRMMKKLVFINKQIKKLVRFSSSSTTIICRKKTNGDQKNTENKTLAIRVVKWKWLKRIIKKTGSIYSTSVNIINQSHAVSIEQIRQFAVDGYVNYVYPLNNRPSKIYDAILNKYIR